MSTIDLALSPLMESFYLKELTVRENEISSSFYANEFGSPKVTVEMNLLVRRHLINNLKSPEDLVRAMVSDYLCTNYNGLTLKKVEEDYPEYGI